MAACLSTASAVRANSDDIASNFAAWNLLLMSAGSFKRQTPVSPFEASWPVVAAAPVDDCVHLPDGSPLLRDSQTSWSVLDF
jgi:hypothetical protein